MWAAASWTALWDVWLCRGPAAGAGCAGAPRRRAARRAAARCAALGPPLHAPRRRHPHQPAVRLRLSPDALSGAQAIRLPQTAPARPYEAGGGSRGRPAHRPGRGASRPGVRPWVPPRARLPTSPGRVRPRVGLRAAAAGCPARQTREGEAQSEPAAWAGVDAPWAAACRNAAGGLKGDGGPRAGRPAPAPPAPPATRAGRGAAPTGRRCARAVGVPRAAAARELPFRGLGDASTSLASPFAAPGRTGKPRTELGNQVTRAEGPPTPAARSHLPATPGGRTAILHCLPPLGSPPDRGAPRQEGSPRRSPRAAPPRRG
jgi:hypothetical protein